MAWLSLAGLALVATTTASAAPEIHETAAERMHRQGVYCMDVIERSECAIGHFEDLLDHDTRQRELLTDAMLRLMTLYRREGREEDISPLLRRFWDAGGERRSRGHVPYSARFIPTELNMLINVDPPRILDSPLLERNADFRDYLFTCDPVLRHDILFEHRWRNAAKKAAEQKRETWEVFYEDFDERSEAKRDYERKREARADAKGEEEPDPPPLVFELACPLGAALGQPDNSTWRRMTGASHHRERDKVVAIFQLPELETHMAAAVKEGRMVREGPGRWRLPEFEYGEQSIRFASLDLDELVAAPVALLDEMEAARRKRKRRMNRELDRLVAKVPRDTAMFVVLNQAALRELGFGEMERRSARGMLEALLPRPKGLQVAAVFGEGIGMFTRVPTNSALKGRMLIGIANSLLARSAEDDPEAARWIEGLDIAEASDRKALLASYVVSAARLAEILWD